MKYNPNIIHGLPYQLIVNLTRSSRNAIQNTTTPDTIQLNSKAAFDKIMYIADL